ncbi:methylaspartate mutase [Streptomyces sp. NPDC002685]|uniref:methylaspartate mutase n=1 Tax=Streptomyces sp. NPDC002685 TaxID=3154540 RepID=UPI003324B8F8
MLNPADPAAPLAGSVPSPYGPDPAELGGLPAAVARARARGELVVQPRMGFGTVSRMRAGLTAVHDCDAVSVGTVTVDSFTRVNDHDSARRALAGGADLNGFPLVAHGPTTTRRMLDGLLSEHFPVQVRHGSALPYPLFQSLTEAGLTATEGGPVSYCLPYSRTPLDDSIEAWSRCCELLASTSRPGAVAHLESFGGCMLGQLCPPSLLIALSVLECLFFRQHGLRSVSLSYAQQTSPAQDREALAALRRLAGELLSGMDWHIVLYTYMGVFPQTRAGALALLGDSARLAVTAGAERLIVKTPAEAHRIPTIEENVQSLEHAAQAARGARAPSTAPEPVPDTGIYREAAALVERTLALHPRVGRALGQAFRLGTLDVPYCLHPDNAQRARAVIDDHGHLRWASVGAMPLPRPASSAGARLTSTGLLHMLHYTQRRYDVPAPTPRQHAITTVGDKERAAAPLPTGD